MIYFPDMPTYLAEIDAVVAGEGGIIGDVVRIARWQEHADELWFVSGFFAYWLLTQGNTNLLEHTMSTVQLYCGQTRTDGNTHWDTFAGQVRAKITEHTLNERGGILSEATDLRPLSTRRGPRGSQTRRIA